MSEQLIAARAALTELITVAQAQIDRARAALAALDGDTTPMVRPAPTPDIIDAPVVLPKQPQREQRPAAAKAAPGQSKYDLAEVAQIARAAIEAGQQMGNAIAVRFGITTNNAAQLIAKARKAGHEIARASDDVAKDVACPDCGKQVSRMGIGTHRRMSHPAVVNHEVEVERAATQDIYKCTTCSAVFRERPKLANHTITSHDRGPTSTENTPLAERVAA